MTSRRRPCALLFRDPTGPAAEPGVLRQRIDALHLAGFEEVAVVASSGGSSLAGLPGVRVVLHSGAWKSAFDEIVLGLFALDRDPVLVLPATHDALDDDFLAKLALEAARGSKARALVFERAGRGTPILLFRAGIDAIVREAANPQGMRALDQILRSWASADVQMFPLGAPFALKQAGPG